MKAKKLNELTNEELVSQLENMKKELFNLRLSHATGQLSNPKSLTNCKKDIARVMTILRQREIGATAVKA